MDKRRRTYEFLTQLRGQEDNEFFDDVSAMGQTTRESIQSQHEWHRRDVFKQSTCGWGKVYEEGQSFFHGAVRGHRGERSIPKESEFNLRGAIPELVKSKSLRQPKLKIKHQQRMSNDDINTSCNPIRLEYIFEDVDPLSEWLQEKDNPLLDDQNSCLFPVDSSDDEINTDGDGQDNCFLSPTYDDDRESGVRGEIRSSRRHEGKYGIGFASVHCHHMSEFGGNMSATPSGSRERSEPSARSKEKGKGTKMPTSEVSSSRRRSNSTNPGYTNSSTNTHGFYPPGLGNLYIFNLHIAITTVS
ncbi:hypothetical protein V6N11_031162 [Hibiscus sabdariffa]|uniref:Uncharacterized protein n=1 Tax=Hibiscus sabdariffa TaxID=183260 RepID=A0ABR1ZLU9_9ROSI